MTYYIENSILFLLICCGHNMSRVVILIFFYMFSSFVYAKGIDITSIAEQENMIADNSLNNAYSQLNESIRKDYPKHDENMKELLSEITESQRSWIKFRDLNCAVESFSAETYSSVHELLLSKCITRMSNARATELQQIGKEY